MNRLILIDGNAAMHRAYHAIPPMRAADGAPANAVYGFASMLIKVFGDLHPTHIAVAFDRAAPTFRKKLFEGYQSKRPKMEDDLSSQIDLIHELIAAFGIPIYEQDGFEADDVIGTVCRQVNRKQKTVNSKTKIDQVIIMTGDRDILQLVRDEKVMVYMPTKGLSEGKIYSEKDVLERMGVLPAKIPDFKGLAGDPSDNYQGAPGIGPKTAVNLINQFGSFTGVYRSLKDIKGMTKAGVSDGMVAKLKAGKESAKLSYNLATIRTDAPIKFISADAKVESLLSRRSISMLEILNFPSLIKRLSIKGHVSRIMEKTEEKDNANKAKELGQQQVLF